MTVSAQVRQSRRLKQASVISLVFLRLFLAAAGPCLRALLRDRRAVPLLTVCGLRGRRPEEDAYYSRVVLSHLMAKSKDPHRDLARLRLHAGDQRHRFHFPLCMATGIQVIRTIESGTNVRAVVADKSAEFSCMGESIVY